MKHHFSYKQWLSIIVLIFNSHLTHGQLFESFESGLPNNYNSELTNVTLNSGTWQIKNVIYSTTANHSGFYSAQLKSETGSQIISPYLSNGVESISFYIKSSTTEGAYQVNISTDNGDTWTTAPGSPFKISETKTHRTITINNINVNKIQIYRTGATLYIDDINISYLTTPCINPTCSFVSENINKTTTDATFINTFTSESTTNKLWSSSNTSVATVNANTGEVTITGAGIANIQVTQEADATYCAVTESYLLTVIKPEPTAHITNPDAVSNGSSALILAWTDAADADGYLIKATTTGYEAITTPVDGIPETDETLVKNVLQGEEIVEFTDLTASTTYYFKIWPYSNSDTKIDYKTDGTAPIISATTTPPTIPTATTATGISTVGFTANWNAVIGATEYQVNVFTKENGSTVEIIKEEFSWPTNSTGGNDDLWSGSIASATTGLSDHLAGWEATTAYKGNYCIRIGSASTQGSLTTPVLDINGNATLTFRAGAWNTTSEQTELLLDITGGGILSVSLIQLEKSKFTNYNIDITGGTSTTKISFIGKKETNSRFFLDDVLITENYTSSTPISGSPFTVTGATSKAITGLNPDTEYFYTVIAKSSNQSSEVSNEISVVTDIAIETEVNASEISDGIERKLVINQGGHLTLNANKSFHSVTLKPRAKLTLNDGQTFSPGTFTLESDASGTATFVDKREDAEPSDIIATVQQHLPAASTRTWWYLASPVDGASYTVFGSNKVGDYSETTRSYSNPFAAPTTLTAGKGYVVKITAESAANYIFENQTLNTGDISIGVTRTVTEKADNAKRGFNLVGNPYPSYLNWELVYAASTNIRSTIWYRTLDKGSMAFYTYNAKSNISVPDSAHGYIPPMQAFWVKVDTDPVSPATVSNGTLNFTNDMRSHDESVDGNPLKAPAADHNLVRLSISNGTLSDETVIATHPSASDSYDRFDSEKMANGDTNRPEIFSMAGNQELVINGISPLTDSKQIALGVRPGRAGNYTISLTEWRNTSNMEAVLRDNQLGEELILTESSSYSFDTDGNTSKSRFSLLFRAKESTTGFDRISSDLMIYTTAQSIRMESESLEGNNVSVHNALGQSVFSGKAQSNRLEINGLTPAVYMVKVNNQTKMVIVK